MMEIRMLGPFGAWHEGAELDLGELQQRLTLAVLVLGAGRPVSTERLVAIVWRDVRKKPANPKNLVAGYISELRRIFREAGVGELIERVATGYRIRLAENGVDTDVARFERLLKEASAARADRQLERALELLREAVGLRRGSFMEDLDHSRIGEPDHASIEDRYVDAVGDLARLELDAGNHRRARDLLRPMVNEQPTRQRHAALLVQSLLDNGDAEQAVAVFERVRRALLERGMEPGTELRGLHRLAKLGRYRNTLPRQATEFTGRVEELSLIERRALAETSAGRSTVVWISGTPGVGKTALAVRAGHRLRSAFLDGQVFVSLEGFTFGRQPISVFDALGKLLIALDVPVERLPTTEEERSTLYRNLLANTRTLAILDNAASAEQVRPLLPPARCLAIVTSRRISDLEGATAIRLEPLQPNLAVELFEKLVGADRVRGDLDSVYSLVKRCGYQPVKIKTVAGWLGLHRTWGVRHAVQQVEEAGLRGDAADSAYAVSYAQLSAEQRMLFRLFGLIPGADVSVHGAAALLGRTVPEARRLLEELQSVSLLEELVPGRYQMLDPLKEYAASLAHGTALDETARAFTGLLGFYVSSAEDAIGTVFPFDRASQPPVQRVRPRLPTFAGRADALDWLSTERANMVAAIGWAAEHGLSRLAWQLAVLLWRYFYTFGHLEDWIEPLDLALAALASDEAGTGRAHVLLRLAAARWRKGEPDIALELATQALALWSESDGLGRADTLCVLAQIDLTQGRQGLAEDRFQDALATYEHVENEPGQANAQGMLGLLLEQRGDFEQAERRHLAAARLLERVGHIPGLISTLNNLGCVRQRLSRFDEAMVDHERAYELAVEFGNVAGQVNALANMGNVHCLCERYDEALRRHEQARELADKVNDPAVHIVSYLGRGDTHLARGDLTAARQCYFAALDLAAGSGNRVRQAQANRGAAKVMHEIDDHDAALEYWRDALSAFAEFGWPEAQEIRRELHGLTCGCAQALIS